MTYCSASDEHGLAVWIKRCNDAVCKPHLLSDRISLHTDWYTHLLIEITSVMKLDLFLFPE